MESYRLKSKVAINDREYMLQTTNDTTQPAVVTSLFVDGEILEVTRLPHREALTDDAVLNLVKETHDVKKSELEQLLLMYQKVRGSGDFDLMLSLGTAFYYRRIFDEARDLFQTILELKPDNHQAAGYLGLTCMETGDQEGAVKAFALAVELRPTFADYHNYYGESLLEAGFCQRAVEEFQAAVRLNIYYADAYFNLGMAHIVNAVKREDFQMYANLKEKTTDLLNRAVLISPEYKNIQYEEALEVFNKNDLPRALNLLRAVRTHKKELNRQRFSGFYLRFLLQSDWANEKIIEDRILMLRDEISRNPNYVDRRYELALCHLQLAQLCWQKGIETFKETVGMNPRLIKAQKALDTAGDFADVMKKVVADIAGSGRED